MTETLTKKQKQVLDHIEEFIKEHGFAPSYREIAEHFDLSSVATVHEHVRTLEDKGYIKVREGEARAIEITSDGGIEYSDQKLELPLAGLITAGEPIEAVEDGSKNVVLPEIIINSAQECFALR